MSKHLLSLCYRLNTSEEAEVTTEPEAVQDHGYRHDFVPGQHLFNGTLVHQNSTTEMHNLHSSTEQKRNDTQEKVTHMQTHGNQ